MPDPALAISLAGLEAVLKRLNKESDTLNARISDFEAALVALNPGITAWCAEPIRLNEADVTGSQLGFTKHQDQWGLWVVRGRFGKGGGKWRLQTGNLVQSVVRLVDATREERASAVDAFSDLVEALTKEAKERLAVVEAANKRAQ